MPIFYVYVLKHLGISLHCAESFCLLWQLSYFWTSVGNGLSQAQERFQSSYIGSLAHRARNADEASEVAHLKELYRRNDPEAVIRLFESQPSLHTNPSALSQYIKALVRVNRLDESELLRTLRRGGSMAITTHFLVIWPIFIVTIGLLIHASFYQFPYFKMWYLDFESEKSYFSLLHQQFGILPFSHYLNWNFDQIYMWFCRYFQFSEGGRKYRWLFCI